TIGTSMGSSAELKHGPLTMVKNKVVLFLVPPSTTTGYHKINSNIHEVKTRDAKIIVFATQGDEEIAKLTILNYIDDAIWIPKTHELVAPILYIVPLYLLIYYLAIKKIETGIQIYPDSPRHLAKAITVD
ncbi:MAG: SIS domain-containing protein, partial [Bacteroidales bacterium]|nr:SIS domain-containing protein [Bacteroidales bacterium]